MNLQRRFFGQGFQPARMENLIKTIKKNEQHQPENILFIKWDCFSRSIEYAYQMIGILRRLNTQAMAIDHH